MEYWFIWALTVNISHEQTHHLTNKTQNTPIVTFKNNQVLYRTILDRWRPRLAVYSQNTAINIGKDYIMKHINTIYT